MRNRVDPRTRWVFHVIGQLVIGDSATIAGHDFYHKLLEYFELHDAYQTVWNFS